MKTYEVSWQFEQGDLEWADSFLYYAKDITDLASQLRAIRDDKAHDEDTDMAVIFAQDLDDDDADADMRDITDELPEDLLAE